MTFFTKYCTGENCSVIGKFRIFTTDRSIGHSANGRASWVFQCFFKLLLYLQNLKQLDLFHRTLNSHSAHVIQFQ